MLRRLLKHRGLGVNLLAGICFLFLAVYGWGISWGELGGYLLVLLVLLVAVVTVAALLGWLIHKIKSSGAKSRPRDKDDIQ